MQRAERRAAPKPARIPLYVIPAKAGIHPQLTLLDPGFRRDDSCSGVRPAYPLDEGLS